MPRPMPRLQREKQALETAGGGLCFLRRFSVEKGRTNRDYKYAPMFATRRPPPGGRHRTWGGTGRGRSYWFFFAFFVSNIISEDSLSNIEYVCENTKSDDCIISKSKKWMNFSSKVHCYFICTILVR